MNREQTFINGFRVTKICLTCIHYKYKIDYTKGVCLEYKKQAHCSDVCESWSIDMEYIGNGSIHKILKEGECDII